MSELLMGHAFYAAVIKRFEELNDEERTSLIAWERDDFTCQLCGHRKYLTIDHITPESKGGTLESDNLQTLCRLCNSKKGDR